MQTAADSAAMAAAQELNYGDAVAAGQTDAATNGQNGVTATINNPPRSGPNINDVNYVEPIVPQPQSTFFLRALGLQSINVTFRPLTTFVESAKISLSRTAPRSDIAVAIKRKPPRQQDTRRFPF